MSLWNRWNRRAINRLSKDGLSNWMLGMAMYACPRVLAAALVWGAVLYGILWYVPNPEGVFSLIGMLAIWIYLLKKVFPSDLTNDGGSP